MVKTTIDRMPVAESEATDEKEIAVMGYTAATSNLLNAAAEANREGYLPADVSYEENIDDEGNHSRQLIFPKGGKRLVLRESSSIHEPWNANYSREERYIPGGTILDKWSATDKKVASTVANDGGPTEEKDPSVALMENRIEGLAEYQSVIEANAAPEDAPAVPEDAPAVRFRRLRRAFGKRAVR